jgi:hypothetical protein
VDVIERVLDARANCKALKLRSDVLEDRAYDNGFRAPADLAGFAFVAPIVSLGVIPDSLLHRWRFFIYGAPLLSGMTATEGVAGVLIVTGSYRMRAS